ncbi:MAG: response regulator [Terracidiphilus sp.]|jgi:DNA-binding NtrC family response regulator
MMLNARATLLFVDDEPSIRETTSMVLTEIGYRVRSANDGFSALRQMRDEVPDILLSDLNMPNMSGFELLSIVRRRFPAIRTIAMSGMFRGDEVPSGVIADAFYEKGCSIGSLLKIIGRFDLPAQRPANDAAASAPLWIQQSESDSSGESCVMISCPECLRSFHHAVGGSLSPVREAICIHCQSPVYYAIAEPVDRTPAVVRERAYRKPNQLASPNY